MILFYQYIIYYLWPCCNTNVFWAMRYGNESRMVVEHCLGGGCARMDASQVPHQTWPRSQTLPVSGYSDPRPSNIAHRDSGYGLGCTGLYSNLRQPVVTATCAAWGRRTTACPPSCSPTSHNKIPSLCERR